jgi:endoglucanase
VLKPLLLASLTSLGALAHAQTEAVVRWNQQGYAPDQPKEIIVMSQHDLAGTTWQVGGPGTDLSGDLGASALGVGPNTPWPFNYRIDLSAALREIGDYQLTVGQLESVELKVRATPYAALANLPLIHLRMQRSGTDTVTWREASHFGDAEAILHVPDGDPADGKWKAAPDDRRIDVLGGWYDAGDHLKFTLTTSYTIYHLLLAYEAAPEIFETRHSTSDLPDILDEIRHGLHYVLKLWPDRDTFIVQVGDSSDHSVGWRLPADDEFDGQRPAKAALARVQMASVVAVLARGARVMAPHDPVLAGRCAAMARALMERIQEPDTVPVAFERASTNDFYLDRSEADQMSLAALEMAALDGDKDGLKIAEHYAPGKGREVSWSYWHWLPNTGLAAAGIAAGQEALAAEVADYLTHATEKGQPWGIPTRYMWGSVARWIGAANAARVAAAEGVVGPDGDALFYGVLDYVFGRNNWGVSFLFDERLPNRLEELYSPTAYLLERYPVGALSAGPTTRHMHGPMEQFFNEPDSGRLAAFDTEVAVFHDNRWDFVCHESTIGAQADIVLMLALASRQSTDPLGWKELP